MVDFHSHVLPGMDDGADSVEMSLRMLEESARQGVDLIFATSHFYADEDDPHSFLQRRNEAYQVLRAAMEKRGGRYPGILLGAEVLYFPGMSVADELRTLAMGNTNCLLVEPPLVHWTDTMLDEIEETGTNLKCIPVIAHIDRYMRILKDNTLFDRIEGRKMLVQVNASFFVYPETAEMALRYLQADKIHFVGSDCHNMTSRAPNLAAAADNINRSGCAAAFEMLNRRVYTFLDTCQKAY